MSKDLLYKAILSQYLNDDIGKKIWKNININLVSDFISLSKTIFMHGACIDFSNTIHDLTNWPIYEIQWGEAFSDAPDDCKLLHGVHRVIKHPSGRYFDISGWTDFDTVLKFFGAENKSYKWFGEVDYGAEIFNVDNELLKKAVKSLTSESLNINLCN